MSHHLKFLYLYEEEPSLSPSLLILSLPRSLTWAVEIRVELDPFHSGRWDCPDIGKHFLEYFHTYIRKLCSITFATLLGTDEANPISWWMSLTHTILIYGHTCNVRLLRNNALVSYNCQVLSWCSGNSAPLRHSAACYFLNSNLIDGSHSNLLLCSWSWGVKLITQWLNKGILGMTKIRDSFH